MGRSFSTWGGATTLRGYSDILHLWRSVIFIYWDIYIIVLLVKWIISVCLFLSVRPNSLES